MRTLISLLVTSFVFGSLAVNFQGIGNSLSKEMFSTSGEQELLLSRSNPHKPKAPHRGSGRREFMEYSNNA
ncbi:heterocyst-inhibiting protein PatX [Calothrix sp. CCY 0018]|uniref:heterocyst-inhibiting protein PatX n=1 Tax=Calothrix sp. CCY 0018 TaxID=3103864 RepID=UPI0039C73599